MMQRSHFPAMLLLTLLCLAIPFNSVWASPHHDTHYHDQFSMEVGALMGPDNTELRLDFTTSDPDDFPLPCELEKLKVKVHQGRHSHGHLINERNVDLVDGHLVQLLEDAPLHSTLKVEAEVRVDRRTVKLTGYVQITLRPDLIIESVGFPATVFVDQPFNVDVNLQELLGDNGALADVNLYADGLAMTTPGVSIAPEAPASVIFAGISFSNPGTITFTAEISNAMPAEYDVSNNSFSFDVEVLPLRTLGETEYFMTYDNFNNVSEGSWNDRCGDLEEEEYGGDFDRFYLDGNSVEALPGGVLDISLTLSADGVQAYSLEMEGLSPYQIVNGYEQYEFSDDPSGLHVFYARNPGVAAFFSINKYSGQEIYVNRFNGVITYSYIQDYGPHMDAQSNIQVSVLIDDGVASIGGTASVDLEPPVLVDDSFSYTFNDAECGPYTYAAFSIAEYSHGESFGIMDPSFMAKPGRQTLTEVVLPESVFLSENYPNPFNPTTTISFGLPEADRVSLTVYDISGRQVLSMAKGLYPAGQHDIQLDASQLSSGSYFYMLETGSFKEVKRMLLLK